MLGRRIARRIRGVADTIFFLACPDSRHLTGQVIHVNGGAYTAC